MPLRDAVLLDPINWLTTIVPGRSAGGDGDLPIDGHPLHLSRGNEVSGKPTDARSADGGISIA
jgi:hypothetical protein